MTDTKMRVASMEATAKANTMLNTKVVRFTENVVESVIFVFRWRPSSILIRNAIPANYY